MTPTHLSCSRSMRIALFSSLVVVVFFGLLLSSLSNRSSSAFVSAASPAQRIRQQAGFLSAFSHLFSRRRGLATAGAPGGAFGRASSAAVIIDASGAVHKKIEGGSSGTRLLLRGAGSGNGGAKPETGAAAAAAAEESSPTITADAGNSRRALRPQLAYGRALRDREEERSPWSLAAEAAAQQLQSTKPACRKYSRMTDCPAAPSFQNTNARNSQRRQRLPRCGPHVHRKLFRGSFAENSAEDDAQDDADDAAAKRVYFAVVGDYGLVNAGCVQQVAALLNRLERELPPSGLTPQAPPGAADAAASRSPSDGSGEGGAGRFSFVVSTGDNAYWHGHCHSFRDQVEAVFGHLFPAAGEWWSGGSDDGGAAGGDMLSDLNIFAAGGDDGDLFAAALRAESTAAGAAFASSSSSSPLPPASSTPSSPSSSSSVPSASAIGGEEPAGDGQVSTEPRLANDQGKLCVVANGMKKKKKKKRMS